MSFRADPPDSVIFEYSSNGEVIVRLNQQTGDGGTGEVTDDEKPIDEEQEADHPFAIKVKVTSTGLDGDWSTAQVGVVSGLYRTAGGTNYKANEVDYPDLAYAEAVSKEAYTGFVYILIPLVSDNANGVPAANLPNKVRAVAGGIIKLWKAPISVWPIVSKTTLFPGVAVAATAVHIGSWGVSRVNVSAGVPTYELRVQLQQNVADNIVLGDDSQYGDVISPLNIGFGARRTADLKLLVAAGLIYVPLTMAPALTVAEATSAANDTHAWLKVEWNTSYMPTTATMTFGTAWPSLPYSVADKYINLPIAYIDSGSLVQVRTGNIMLHLVGATGGWILTPAAL